MTRLIRPVLASGILGAWALVACSSSSTNPTPSPGVDSSVPAEGGGADTSTGPDGGADAAPEPENQCVTFVDRTADSASRTITWDLSVVSAPERCIKIKAGQTVTWGNGAGAAADFDAHPLTVYKPGGGTAPMADTTTGKATFPTASLFGFACGIHPTMRGVVLVE